MTTNDQVKILRDELKRVVRQNEHEMLLTGDECRAIHKVLRDTESAERAATQPAGEGYARFKCTGGTSAIYINDIRIDGWTFNLGEDSIRDVVERINAAAPISEDTAKEALRTEVQLRGHIHMLNDEIEELKEQLAARTPASVGSEAKGEAAVECTHWSFATRSRFSFICQQCLDATRTAAAPERSGKAADELSEGAAFDFTFDDLSDPAGNSSAAPGDATATEKLDRWWLKADGVSDTFVRLSDVEKLVATAFIRPALSDELLAQAIDACEACMDVMHVEPEDAAAWQVVRAALSAPAPTGGSLSVPDGMQLVPIEPTEAMDKAARDECNRMAGVIDPVIHIWDVMLATAKESA